LNVCPFTPTDFGAHDVNWLSACRQLRAAGWAVQDKDSIDFNEGEGQAVREEFGEGKSPSANPTTNAL
jgi:hypothetical protein